MALTPNRLAVIHITQRELGIDDAEYRRVLLAVAGVHSAKDLDEAGFRHLMRYLVRSSHYRRRPGGLTFRQKLLIASLQRELGWTDEHLGHFVAKYYHHPDLGALSRKDGIHLIESLKHVRQHRHPPAPPTQGTLPMA